MGNDLKSKQKSNSEISFYILQLQSILRTLQKQHNTKLYNWLNFTK